MNLLFLSNPLPDTENERSTAGKLGLGNRDSATRDSGLGSRDEKTKDELRISGTQVFDSPPRTENFYDFVARLLVARSVICCFASLESQRESSALARHVKNLGRRQTRLHFFAIE